MARPFRLVAPELYEIDVYQQCAVALDKLLMPPAIWCCYPAGALQLLPQQTARLMRLGLKPGWPDLLIGHKGMFGVEVKRIGGRLSKTRMVRTKRGSPRVVEGQEDVFPRLLASGAFAAIAVVSSVDEMLAQLRQWEIPIRSALCG